MKKKKISDLLSHRTIFHLLSHALSARSRPWHVWKRDDYGKMPMQSFGGLLWILRACETANRARIHRILLVFSAPRDRLTRRFTSLFFSRFEKDNFDSFFSLSHSMKHIHPSIWFHVIELNFMWVIEWNCFCCYDNVTFREHTVSPFSQSALHELKFHQIVFFFIQLIRVIEAYDNEAFKKKVKENVALCEKREKGWRNKNDCFLVVAYKQNWYNGKRYAVMLIGHVA